MHTTLFRSTVAWVACVVLAGVALAQSPLGGGFTYQGQLKQNGAPFTGNATIRFDLYDGPTGGNLIGTETLGSVSVTAGLFTVVLNDAGQLGANAFHGDARWLAITVNGAPLTPRQPLTAAPYALFSTAGSATELQMHPVNVVAPTSGQVLKWDGAQWSPATVAGTAYSAGAGLQLLGATFSVAPNGVVNSMLASDAASLNKVSGGLLYCNPVTPFFGVGSATPVLGLDQLEVTGTNAGFNGMSINGPAGSHALYNYIVGGNVAWTDFDGSNWHLQNGGTYKLTVTSTGLVGIGESNPAVPLNFASVTGNKLSLWGNNAAAFYGFGVASSQLQIHADNANSDIVFGYGGTTLTERMRIKGNGNVGIGEANPTIPLTFAAAGGNKISLSGNNPAAFYGLGVAGGQLQIHADTANSDIVFGSGGTALNEVMRIKGNGQVGIGMAPISSNTLTIKGPVVEFDSNSHERIDVGVNAYDNPVISGWRPAGEPVFVMGGGLGTGSDLVVGRNSTYHFAAMGEETYGGYLDISNNAGHIAGGFEALNTGEVRMFADVKNFQVPNPRNPAENIVYACVEGPEAAAYVRGTGWLENGAATIALPEHFQDVTVSEGLTIQLTPRSADSEGLAVVQSSNAGFQVVELRHGRGSYAFDWEVKAVRRGHEDYQPVRPAQEPRASRTPASALGHPRKAAQE